MNRALPLHPYPASRETLFSFLSRFAAMNAATATDFAFDLGFGIKRFIRFEGEALDRLVEAAAIDAQSLENLISWTGRPVGDAWTEFRGERYPSKAVRNPVMRGCPMCLREDASANPQSPTNMMVMRGDWLLRDVTICCRHNHPIVPLWQCSSAAERFDIGVHLHDLAPAIILGDLDQPLRQPSPYDLWLNERLENGKDATWLANHSLFVATTMCQLLGACLIQQPSDGGSDPAPAQAAGFGVLSQGETELRRALKSLAAAVNSNWISITRTYGKLYQALDDYLTDDGFDLFRNILPHILQVSR